MDCCCIHRVFPLCAQHSQDRHQIHHHTDQDKELTDDEVLRWTCEDSWIRNTFQLRVKRRSLRVFFFTVDSQVVRDCRGPEEFSSWGSQHSWWWPISSELTSGCLELIHDFYSKLSPFKLHFVKWWKRSRAWILTNSTVSAVFFFKHQSFLFSFWEYTPWLSSVDADVPHQRHCLESGGCCGMFEKIQDSKRKSVIWSEIRKIRPESVSW